MKILIKETQNDDGYTIEKMFIDGRRALRVGPLCERPGDAIVGGALVTCSDVAVFMQLAYEACRNGEEFSIRREPWD